MRWPWGVTSLQKFLNFPSVLFYFLSAFYLLPFSIFQPFLLSFGSLFTFFHFFYSLWMFCFFTSFQRFLVTFLERFFTSLQLFYIFYIPSSFPFYFPSAFFKFIFVNLGKLRKAAITVLCWWVLTYVNFANCYYHKTILFLFFYFIFVTTVFLKKSNLIRYNVSYE